MKKYGTMTLLAGLLIPGVAFAQIGVGDTLGSSEAEIRATLEAQGLTVTEFELEDGEIEVEAMLNDKPYEIEVSTETGMVLEVELDDETGSDDG